MRREDLGSETGRARRRCEGHGPQRLPLPARRISCRPSPFCGRDERRRMEEKNTEQGIQGVWFVVGCDCTCGGQCNGRRKNNAKGRDTMNGTLPAPGTFTTPRPLSNKQTIKGEMSITNFANQRVRSRTTLFVCACVFVVRTLVLCDDGRLLLLQADTK